MTRASLAATYKNDYKIWGRRVTLLQSAVESSHFNKHSLSHKSCQIISYRTVNINWHFMWWLLGCSSWSHIFVHISLMFEYLGWSPGSTFCQDFCKWVGLLWPTSEPQMGFLAPNLGLRPTCCRQLGIELAGMLLSVCHYVFFPVFITSINKYLLKIDPLLGK